MVISPFKTSEDVMFEMNIVENIVPLCPDGVIGVDRKGTVVVFNRAAEKLTGYSMDEVDRQAPYYPDLSSGKFGPLHQKTDLQPRPRGSRRAGRF